MAHPRLTEQPRFYFDLASPEAYLVAERLHHVLGVVPRWEPVRAAELPGGGLECFRCAEEEVIHRAAIELRAAAYGLQPLRWPDPFPFESLWALLAATFAKQIGRAVAFSLAAFRQAYAGGRDLGQRDNVLIAAAACEMHPAAVIRGAELRGTRERLEQATAEARAAGVRAVPALVTPDGRLDELGTLR